MQNSSCLRRVETFNFLDEKDFQHINFSEIESPPLKTANKKIKRLNFGQFWTNRKHFYSLSPIRGNSNKDFYQKGKRLQVERRHSIEVLLEGRNGIKFKKNIFETFMKQKKEIFKI